MTLALTLVVGLMVGCNDGAGPRMDSNSNWLSQCLQNSDCAEGSQCICGVCTRSCPEQNDCDAFSSALCAGGDSASVSTLCGVSGDSGGPVCLPTCEGDGDCADSQDCVSGACVVPNAAGQREEGLCGASSGDWTAEGCGHTICGQERECEVATAGCDCGPNGIFDRDMGCRVTPDCMDLDVVQELCRDTDGRWVVESCGNWTCGLEPECESPFPGCDCGEGQSFESGVGCVVDGSCGEDGERMAACTSTGGTWEPESCGDYDCGVAPTCEVVEPGCDCGLERNFVDGEGCLVDADCDLGPDAEALCGESDGTWDVLSCGHYECGVPPDCEIVEPGCDCGPERNFAEGEGCVGDDGCTVEPTAEDLCLDSDGDWLIEVCGHFECGEQGTCEVPAPGCDCGAERGFVEGDGCSPDEECVIAAEQALCDSTDGIWDAEGCGHYDCGEAGTCDIPEPGCNCGAQHNFVAGEGCAADELCPEPGPEVLCDSTDGLWVDEACGHLVCGEIGACEVPEPGCDCGDLRVFADGEGCVENEDCVLAARMALCSDTEGTWVEVACGDYECGDEGTCEVPAPGCDCGIGRNFGTDAGCGIDLACGAPAHCLNTEGTWDIEACGHYDCGVAPACGEVIGGCDCGGERNFTDEEGCLVDEVCSL